MNVQLRHMGETRPGEVRVDVWFQTGGIDAYVGELTFTHSEWDLLRKTDEADELSLEIIGERCPHCGVDPAVEPHRIQCPDVLAKAERQEREGRLRQ